MGRQAGGRVACESIWLVAFDAQLAWGGPSGRLLTSFGAGARLHLLEDSGAVHALSPCMGWRAASWAVAASSAKVVEVAIELAMEAPMPAPRMTWSRVRPGPLMPCPALPCPALPRALSQATPGVNLRTLLIRPRLPRRCKVYRRDANHTAAVRA